MVQTSFIGDMVLTTPLLAALALDGPVDVVATPASAGLLANHPAVRHVHPYDKRGRESGVRGFVAMARRLRADGPHEVAYLAQGSLRSAALALAAGVRERVGFDRSAGRLLYSRRVPYDVGAHHARRLWQLAGRDVRPDGGAPPVLRPRLYPGPAEERAVDALLAEHRAAGEPLVALAPGSVWATKRWPYYAALASLLSRRGRVVVIGGADDSGLAHEIVATTNGAAIDATGRLSLLASAALLGRVSLLVTNDSAPQHLASAMDTPTITIFGPTVPDFGFGPLATDASTAGVRGLACRPCHPHGPPRCPLGHWRCMRDLSVDDVLRAVAAVDAHTTPG